MEGSAGELAAGDVIAGYTVIRLLGAGGQGRVYLARHPRLPRNQAIKVLPPGLGADPEFRERFRRESDLAARLEHPHIVAVQDAGVDGETMWIAMQYVDGTDAAALRRQSTTGLPAARALDIVRQVAAGLDYAHARGMVHRDVKPANILVSRQPDGTQWAFITDFGIARSLAESAAAITHTGTMLGTIAYTAPELLAGDDLSPEMDQYALACTLYELLAAEAVFPLRDALAVMNAHGLTRPPKVTTRRPDLPAALDDVIARGLAKRPADRFPSCGAFAAAAAQALSGARSTVPRPAAPPTLIRPLVVPHDMTMMRPVISQTPSGPRLPPAQAPEYGQEPVPQRPHHRPNRAGLVVVACIGVSAVILAGVFLFMLSGDRTDPTPPATATSPAAITTVPTGARANGNTRTVVPDPAP